MVFLVSMRGNSLIFASTRQFRQRIDWRDTVSIVDHSQCTRSSKGSSHDRRRRQKLRRPDRAYRLGLCQPQPDAGVRNSEPDRPDSRRADAGLGRPGRAAAGAGEARGVGEEVDDARLHRLSRGRQEVQIAQAPSAHAIQHDAGAVSREVGSAGGLSDGRAELCGGAFAARQADGTRPAARGGRN